MFLPFELVHFKVMNQPNMIQRNTRAEREEEGRRGWTSTLLDVYRGYLAESPGQPGR